MKNLKIGWAGCLALAVTAMGCGGEGEDTPSLGEPEYVRDPALNVEMDSSHDGDSSHAAGENCMSCHQAHGPGPGLFTAAGTIFRPDGTAHAGATLELRTAPAGGGDLVASVEVDLNGNFYTTQALPLPDQSLFPIVRAASGEGYTYMPFPTASAACNMCHVADAAVVLP